MLHFTVISFMLFVGYGQSQSACNNLDAFACGFNRRLYRGESELTALRFASTVQYQFLRLDHELFTIGQNNCTSIDNKTTLHCTVDQWNELNTVIFEIENISRYREISLQSRFQQSFDQISFHKLPHRNGSDGYFIYDKSTVFDVCSISDEIELTWRIGSALKRDILVECWHHETKVCSKPPSFPNERICDTTNFNNYFEVKLVVTQSVKKMETYYCTIDGGQLFSKTVYWQGPLQYKQLDNQDSFEDSEYVIVLIDEHNKNLTETVHGQLLEQEYLKTDMDTLKKIEDPHINIIDGLEIGPQCNWEEHTEAANLRILKGNCYIFSLSHGLQEEQFYEGHFHASMDYISTQRFMYHQMDGGINSEEVMLYWIVDTRQENITSMECTSNSGFWKYPESLTEDNGSYFKFVGSMAIYALRAKLGEDAFEEYNCRLNENFLLRKLISLQGML